MLAAGANVQRAGLHGLVGFGLLHSDAGKFGELRRVLRGEGRGHVLHEENGSREIARETWSQAHHRGGSSGGGAEHNDREALIERRALRSAWSRRGAWYGWSCAIRADALDRRCES